MFHTSYIEISKSALKSNLRLLYHLTGSKVRYCSVIKGNAYGHGIEQFVPLAESCGVNYFAVYSADEALRASKIRNKGSHIMIMGMIDEDELEWAIENDISFYVFEFKRLEAALKIAERQKKKAKIHVELETGMYRNGFNWKDREKLIRLLQKNGNHLIVMGITTHFAGAESIANYLRIQNQIAAFNKFVDYFSAEGVKPEIRHTASSASLFCYPQTKMDMVRIGIAQYGLWPNKETHMQYAFSEGNNRMTENPLRQVISWKTKVMSINKVLAGNFIGYGTVYQATGDMLVATIPIGYCHGFSRNLSNLGKVLVGGKRVSVIGMVSMNMLTINITHCPNVQIGDEVVLIGSQKNNRITVSSFGELINNANYETLVRLPDDIPRFVVK